MDEICSATDFLFALYYFPAINEEGKDEINACLNPKSHALKTDLRDGGPHGIHLYEALYAESGREEIRYYFPEKYGYGHTKENVCLKIWEQKWNDGAQN